MNDKYPEAVRDCRRGPIVTFKKSLCCASTGSPMKLHPALMQVCLVPHRRLAVLGHSHLLARPAVRGKLHWATKRRPIVRHTAGLLNFPESTGKHLG